MNLWNDARGLMAPLDPHHRQQDGSDCVCVVSCYQRWLDWLGLQANVVIHERFIEWSTTITWNGYVPLLVIGPIDHDVEFFDVDTSSGESWLTHWCSYLISNNAQVHMCLCWDDRRRRRVNKRRCRRRGCPIPMESATAAAQPRVQTTWWCIQYKRVLWIWQKGKMSKPQRLVDGWLWRRQSGNNFHNQIIFLRWYRSSGFTYPDHSCVPALIVASCIPQGTAERLFA